MFHLFPPSNFLDMQADSSDFFFKSKESMLFNNLIMAISSTLFSISERKGVLIWAVICYSQ